MKKSISYFIAFTIIVIVANLPLINEVILSALDHDTFRYSNNDASFTRIEKFGLKDGRINDWLTNRFVEETYPSDNNKEIFRLYRINPLCVWRWRYYIETGINYRYKSWNEIEPNRIPYAENNTWQNF